MYTYNRILSICSCRQEGSLYEIMPMGICSNWEKMNGRKSKFKDRKNFP